MGDGADRQQALYRELLERDDVGPDGLTRRRMVGAAGGAALAGAALSVDRARAGTNVGKGPSGFAVLGLIGIIKQTGTSLNAHGYLTSVRGVKVEDLFTQPRGTSFSDPNSLAEGQAKLTFSATGTIVALSAVQRPAGGDDLASIVASVRASLAIHHQPLGGADFDEPSSFRSGKLVARYTGGFQNNLTLQPPDFLSLASVHLTGNLTQDEAKRFQLSGEPRMIGSRGARRMLAATGWGELDEPTEPRSTIWLSGSLLVDGAPA